MLSKLLKLYPHILNPFVYNHYNIQAWYIMVDHLELPADTDLSKLRPMEEIKSYKQIAVENSFLQKLIIPFINVECLIKVDNHFTIEKEIAQQVILPILKQKVKLLQDTNITYEWGTAFFANNTAWIDEAQYEMLMEQYSIFINNQYVTDFIHLSDSSNISTKYDSFCLQYNTEMLQHQKMIDYEKSGMIDNREHIFLYFLLYYQQIITIYPNFVELLEECLEFTHTKLDIFKP